MLRDWLRLTASVVTVSRVVETPDGYGETTVTTTVTGLPRAAIWYNSQSKPVVSDKFVLLGTHTMVTEPTDYTFTVNDKYVTYASAQYKIVGPSADIMFMGKITVTPLELVQ